jgi:hypothetical protein
MAVLVSGALWLVSILLTCMTIFAIREIVVWGFALTLTDPKAPAIINVVQQWLMIVLGIVALGVILYTGELFFDHAGQPRLMRTFGRIIVVEFLIVLPVGLLFWRV